METPADRCEPRVPGPKPGPRGPKHARSGQRACRPGAAVLGSLTIPGRPEQVGRARAFVAQTVSSRQVAADPDAAALLTSEIVTNALQHTRSGTEGGTVTIVVIGLPHGVLVEVIDDGSAGAPVVKGDLYASAGHGLFLVQDLAAQWGYLRNQAGTTVWFHLPELSTIGPVAAASRSHGTGPGIITPDGCAVDFYAQLPALGEPAIVHGAIGARASILELGCGAGRVTGPLADLGHRVVAVDESPEMLAHVRDAETVCARIEDLSLGRRFDAVLLLSHLINAADDDTRSAFLAACRRHVADDGCVIVQQYAPEWFAAARETEVTRDGVILRMRDVSHPAPNLVSATVEYVVGDKLWTQTFTATRLDESQLAAALTAARLRLDRYLTEDRSWFRAVPVSVPASG